MPKAPVAAAAATTPLNAGTMRVGRLLYTMPASTRASFTGPDFSGAGRPSAPGVPRASRWRPEHTSLSASFRVLVRTRIAPSTGMLTRAAAVEPLMSYSRGTPSGRVGRSVRYSTKSHSWSCNNRGACSVSLISPSGPSGRVSWPASTTHRPPRSRWRSSARSSAIAAATLPGTPGSAMSPTVACRWSVCVCVCSSTTPLCGSTARNAPGPSVPPDRCRGDSGVRLQRPAASR